MLKLPEGYPDVDGFTLVGAYLKPAGGYKLIWIQGNVIVEGSWDGIQVDCHDYQHRVNLV